MRIVMKEDLLAQGYEALDLNRATERVRRWCERTDDEELRHLLTIAYGVLESCGNDFIGREVFYSSKSGRYPVYVPVIQRYCSYEAEILDGDAVTFKRSFCDDDRTTYWAAASEVYKHGLIDETNNLKDLHDTYRGYYIL